jgi:hypothetical protein
VLPGVAMDRESQRVDVRGYPLCPRCDRPIVRGGHAVRVEGAAWCHIMCLDVDMSSWPGPAGWPQAS